MTGRIIGPKYQRLNIDFRTRLMDKILTKEQDSEECVIPGHSPLSLA
jgi:hypothetical protein